MSNGTAPAGTVRTEDRWHKFIASNPAAIIEVRYAWSNHDNTTTAIKVTTAETDDGMFHPVGWCLLDASQARQLAALLLATVTEDQGPPESELRAAARDIADGDATPVDVCAACGTRLASFHVLRGEPGGDDGARWDDRPGGYVCRNCQPATAEEPGKDQAQ